MLIAALPDAETAGNIATLMVSHDSRFVLATLPLLTTITVQFDLDFQRSLCSSTGSPRFLDLYV